MQPVTTNVTLKGNHVHHIRDRNLALNDHSTDLTACINVCGKIPFSMCPNITLQNNVVSGTKFAGFVAYGRACGNESNQ
jgi:hypothetical protein